MSPNGPRRRHRVGAVVLAAGGSSRLGRPKQLVAYAGVPLVARAAAAALDAGAGPVVVVLGAEADAVRAALGALPVAAVVHRGWADGIGTSIAAGVRALRAGVPAVGEPGAAGPPVDGVLLLLADQPLVDAAVLRRLLDAWADAGAGGDAGGPTAAAAAYAETVGVPAVFGRAYFDALCTLAPAAGAGALLRAAGDRVRRVPVPEAAVDVDTPDDLAGLLRLDGRRRPA